MIRTLIEGGYLALWGIAFAVIWYASLRLFYQAHVALAGKGWLPAPRNAMLPMHGWAEPAVAGVALACGVSAMIAFAALADKTLALPAWITPLTLSPLGEVIRILCALVVMIFFLTRVAEHPRWKFWWSMAWTAFALGLAVAT